MKNYRHDIDSETLAIALLKAVARARKVAIIGTICASTTACGTMSAHMPSDNGRILIDADAKGMQAFFDGQNGLITNGKASPDLDTAHWKARRYQEAEVTKREYAPSLLQKLFSSEQPNQAVGRASAESIETTKN